VLTTLLGALDDETVSVNVRSWRLFYNLHGSRNCPAAISDRVITCLEPWAPPLANCRL